MTDIFDRHRIVDFTEHPFVVLVGADGSAEIVGDDQVCKRQAARVLRVVADVLDSEHPQGRCTPTERTPQWSRPDEPLLPHAGMLDRAAQLWTDGTGHVWNLALPWQDSAGSTWLWYGSLDGQGAPLMRSNDWPEPQPLDALRSLRGPMVPVYRGGAS
ncbi:phiSA1p31-related protein [Streptomyces sp. NBUA17]|uniref:phiSA1p31-related protein n=1 Tax=Streptomyces sp. NBUA17 TaxID=3062275 RepID=UPI0037DA0ADD